jgi:hypothetical protein
MLAAYWAGVALPYGLLCLALWRAGVFARFWFWTVTLARAYAGEQSISNVPRLLAFSFPRVAGPDLLLWGLAGFGSALACVKPVTRRAGLFTLALLAFSLLAVSAGGSFNQNYFIMLLPALALGNGAWIASSSGSRVHFLCFAAACLFSVVAQRAYLFEMTPYAYSRKFFGLNPFPEAVKIGDYIRSHSDPGARVAVLGSEAEIYFYSQRQAATGYLFTYGLMESHRYAADAQEDMIREVEASRPEFVVMVGVPPSWMVKPASSRLIFHWADEYISRFYTQVGVVDMLRVGPPRYVWGADAAGYSPENPAFLIVYRRR